MHHHLPHPQNLTFGLFTSLDQPEYLLSSETLLSHPYCIPIFFPRWIFWELCSATMRNVGLVGDTQINEEREIKLNQQDLQAAML